SVNWAFELPVSSQHRAKKENGSSWVVTSTQGRGVGISIQSLSLKDHSLVVKKKTTKRMPNRCIVYGCSNLPNLKEGIALHNIPFWGDERPETKKRRKRWVNFVQTKRAKWKPTKGSSICSKHFQPEDFVRLFLLMPDQGEPIIPRLERDEIGVTAYPSIQVPSELEARPMSDRSRRRALKSIIRESNTVDDPSTSCDAMPIAEGEVEIGASNVDILESDAPEGSFVNNIPDDATHIASKEMDSELDVEVMCNVHDFITCILGKHSRHNKATQTRNENLAHVQGNLTEHEQELDYDMVEDDQDYFSEPEFSNYQMETETETETETDDPDPTITSLKSKLSMEDTNLRTEPKHIVFLSKLLLLFHFCHVCKDDNPLVEISQVGTGVVVTTTCNNEKCPKKKNVWHSQPTIPGWDVPAGNFLLCMAVLLVGGSATKVFQMFSHMGLGCVSLNTFFKHQRRNQAGNSPAMELMGFRQSMDYLIGYGIPITTFISDRHIGIACHMKNMLSHITHYFDIWHLKKKIRKVLTKISQEKGCEELKVWIKPCENHLYWSAISTFDGNGEVIWAKFKSFLAHIINKHTDLEDPLFNKCAHGNIPYRTWLKSEGYQEGFSTITNQLSGRIPFLFEPFFSPKMIAYSYVGMYCRHVLAVVHFNLNLQREEKVREADGVERVKVVYPKFKNGEATVRQVRVKQN
ncbi:hypothetical protein QZH41_008383, partial [Actinostola sp. cb2023]